jgi:uncharacterized membrane protein YadS
VSPSVGDFAVLAKMIRVILLMPVVWGFYWAFKPALRGDSVSPRVPLPWFLIAFAAIAAVSTLGLVPDAVRQFSDGLSRWCLVVAIVALGMKTSISALISTGWRPVVLVLGESVLLGALVLAWSLTM